MTATYSFPLVPGTDVGNHDAGAIFPCHRYGHCTVIEMAGEIDAAAAATLSRLIAETPTARLVIDLTQVTAMESVGVGVLVAAWRHAASTGGAVRLVRPYESPLTGLQDTRVDRLLPILDSTDLALQLDRAAGDGIWDDPAADDQRSHPRCRDSSSGS